MSAPPGGYGSDALVIACLAMLPVAAVVRVVGISWADTGLGIVLACGAAVFTGAFVWLRARRRRKWVEEWEPARMHRRMPRKTFMTGDTWAQDHGYLHGMPPDAVYIFADEMEPRFQDLPSSQAAQEGEDLAFFLRDLVLVGTRRGIMDFLDKRTDKVIENRRTDHSEIYMKVEPYEPGAGRYEVLSVGTPVAIMNRAARHLAGWATGRNPVTEAAGAVSGVSQALDALRDDDGDAESPEHRFAPEDVLSVSFSCLQWEGVSRIGSGTIEFGSVRKILERII